MKNTRHPDYFLIGITSSLIILGVLILASASASLSQEKFGEPTYFLFHQIVLGLIPGLVLGYLVFRVSIDFFKKWSLTLLLINLLAMGLVFIPKIGISLGGAHRWINLGFVSLQPSEFLKITFLLYLAAWVSSRVEIKKKKIAPKSNRESNKIMGRQALVPFLLMSGIISLFLILQPDISSLSIILLIAATIYFSAGTPLYHSILIILMGAASLFLLIKTSYYRLNRLLVFFKPEIDPMGLGYQIKQALIAVGSGGILGQGIGLSWQKFGPLPQPISDSIFAIFAEETGLLGSLLLVLLFLAFAWQGFKISRRAENKFSQLMALGISVWIIVQAFINIGSMVGMLPLTGIPLPFISYGGSALIAELIGVGILLNISRQTRSI